MQNNRFPSECTDIMLFLSYTMHSYKINTVLNDQNKFSLKVRLTLLHILLWNSHLKHLTKNQIYSLDV